MKIKTISEAKADLYNEGVEANKNWCRITECPYEEHTIEHEQWCLGWKAEQCRCDGKPISNDPE